MNTMRYLFIFFVFFFLFPSQHLNTWATDRTDPRYEQRQYRRFILPNSLKVILVSDPTAHHGAASLSVAVGSLSDPPEHQGMAHFLEHMLFLGTEKYPDVDDDKNFLTSHDGFSNAFTTNETTNYYFQVAGEHLEEALDRFAQFFIAPLFNPEYVKRELEVVESEYTQKRPSDHWRVSQVEASLFTPNHPAQNFRIGNLATLQNTSREDLLKFYDKYYSANSMTLAVLGKQDPDTLHEWVETYFSQIRNLPVSPITIPQTYLKKSDQFRVVRIEPLKDTRSLKLIFPLPSIQRLYETKPSYALGHLIGHEGKGSLLSLLKKEGLATGLSAGGSSGKAYGRFTITVQLTPKGLEQYETVVKRIFQYIRLLRRTGFQEELFEELEQMAEIDYRFEEKTDGTDLVIGFASLLHYIPLDLVETAPFLYDRYEPHHFDSILFRLTADNMLVTLIAKGLKTDKTEPYFGANYSYTEDNPDFIRTLQKVLPHEELDLPEKNIFIPENLNLVSSTTQFMLAYQSLVGLKQEQIPQPILDVLEAHQGKYWASWQEFQEQLFPGRAAEIQAFRKLIFKHALARPQKILDNEQGEVWFQQDLRFHTPKAELTLLIHTPRVYSSPKSAVLSQLYTNAINEGLNEFGYAVRIAGLEFGISTGKEGITVNVSGYSDRIFTLSEILLTKLQEITIDEATFQSLKERRLRIYQNFQFNQAYQQAFYARSLLMEEKKFSIDQYQEVIKNITLDDLIAYTKTLYRSFYVQGVVYGNLEKEKARQALQEMLRNLQGQPLPREQLFENTIVRINNSKDFIFSKKVKIDNSALLFEVQVGASNPRLRGAMLIIATALRSWAYSELRTEQQLGYTVFGDISWMEKTLGWMLMVQSGKYPPGLLQERVTAYIPKFIEEFKQLPVAEFENFRQSVINSQLEKYATISEEANFLFYQAFEKDADFDYVSENIKAIEELTRDEVVEILENTLSLAENPYLAIRMVGQSHTDIPGSGIIVQSFDQFKDSQQNP